MSDPETIRPSPDNVCVCFHVPLNKIVKFIRLETPRVASQLSECYGAGTGCGWCIPFLERLFEEMQADASGEPALGLSTAEYLERRREYLRRINAERMKDQRGEDPLAGTGDLME